MSACRHGGPATAAGLAGPAGIALAEDQRGGVTTIFIADYYNGLVRAVNPDGIIRNVSDDGRVTLGAPSRVAFSARTNRLFVADSRDRKSTRLNSSHRL